MTFGLGVFGLDPFGIPDTGPPDEAPIVLVSSRAFDFVTRRYTVDDDGNPEGMRDTAQRVSILVSEAVGNPPDLLDADQYESAMEQNIRAALAPLLAKPPVIELLSVETTRPRPGAVAHRVNFRDLLNGQKASVTL